MIAWAARAKLHLPQTRAGVTAKTDETRLSSVSSAPFVHVLKKEQWQLGHFVSFVAAHYVAKQCPVIQLQRGEK